VLLWSILRFALSALLTYFLILAFADKEDSRDDPNYLVHSDWKRRQEFISNRAANLYRVLLGRPLTLSRITGLETTFLSTPRVYKFLDATTGSHLDR
jgi:hypothetical protein